MLYAGCMKYLSGFRDIGVTSMQLTNLLKDLVYERPIFVLINWPFYNKFKQILKQ